MLHANLHCTSLRQSVPRVAGNGLALIGLLLGMSVGVGDAVGEEPARSDSEAFPEPVTEDDFVALKTRSPFLRSLGPTDSIVLAGVAQIGNDVFVTLVDAETRKCRLVSKTANREGWQLVGFQGDRTDIESLTAKVQVAGGQVISIRYEKLPPRPARPGTVATRLNSSQMNEAKHAAANYAEGFSADGYPRQPPREIVEQLSKMSAQQRETINREMIELRNRGLGMEERRRIYVEKVNRSAGGRR